MSKVVHPLPLNTQVQYLSPRCPCSGKSFAVSNGKIQSATKTTNGKYFYRIVGESKNIPQEGIVKILG